MPNRRTVLASISSLVAIASQSFATTLTGNSAVSAPAAEGHKLLRERGLYLPLLRGLQAVSGSGDLEKELLSQAFALIGDEDNAFAAYQPQACAAPKGSNFQAEPAIDKIVEAARHRQIVILNENHSVSRCRAFAQALMVRLRAEGFNTFAAETFFNEPSPDGMGIGAIALNAGAPVTTSVGHYIADPVYAELVRSARQHKYWFAVYEARQDQMAARERAEADNFISNILANTAKARVFVYCGFGHVIKNRQGSLPFSAFAALLKMKTGIDPLCISQTEGLPAIDPSTDSDLLKWAFDRFSPTEPVVIFDGSGAPPDYSRDAIDFTVVHPRLPKTDGRPGWLAAMPDHRRVHYVLPKAVRSYALVQAVSLPEAMAPNVVPSDQYPITTQAREVVFFLKRGQYEVRLESDTGRQMVGRLSA